jgi:hypothetical protein
MSLVNPSEIQSAVGPVLFHNAHAVSDTKEEVSHLEHFDKEHPSHVEMEDAILTENPELNMTIREAVRLYRKVSLPIKEVQRGR